MIVRVSTNNVAIGKVTVKGLVPATVVDGGGGGSVGESVFNETPSGSINGSNATFTSVFDFIPESVCVFINGLKQKPVTHYNTSGTRTILLTSSPGTSEVVTIDYIKA